MGNDLDAFLECLIQFSRDHVDEIVGFGVRARKPRSRHQCDLPDAVAFEEPTKVHRRIAAPMNDNALGRRELAVVHELFEQRKSLVVVCWHGPAHVPFPALLTARRQKDCAELPFQLADGDIATEARAEFDIDPIERKNSIKFRIEY